jgi:hypothetical protein
MGRILGFTGPGFYDLRINKIKCDRPMRFAVVQSGKHGYFLRLCVLAVN